MQKKVTIQDIADALGISRNTVSKVINNSEGVSDITKDKVLKKAVELGYKQFSYVSTAAGQFFSDVPDDSLQDIQPGSAGEIALFTTTLFSQSHFASVMLDRFHQELAHAGYTFTIHKITPDNIRDKSLPITFIKERVSGIICLEIFDYDYGMTVCQMDLPVLFVDGPIRIGGEMLPCDHLLMENVVGITQFVSRMLKEGKRQIGFVGDWEYCQSFCERYSTYRMTMIMAGESVNSDYLIKTNNADEIQEKIKALSVLPDVFVCANDFIALDTINVLHSMGKSVPYDVLICGFDDAPESRFFSPKLTTVHIHTQIMAHSAAYLLLSRIKDPTLDYRSVYTQAELIYRKSSELS